MCYYNGQRVSRAEFIELKRLAKKVKDYDFLDVRGHNGFEYKPCESLPRIDLTYIDAEELAYQNW